MSGTVIAFVVVALAIGALVGWLVGSRDGAGARQTVESLRLHLDAVVKERDINRDAALRGQLGEGPAILRVRHLEIHRLDPSDSRRRKLQLQSGDGGRRRL